MDSRGQRLLIALVLSFGVLFAWQYFFAPKPEEVVKQEGESSSEQGVKSEILEPSKVEVSVVEKESLEAVESEIGNDSYDLRLSSLGGGRGKSLEIKEPSRYLKHGDFLKGILEQKRDDVLPFRIAFPQLGVSGEEVFSQLEASGTEVRYLLDRRDRGGYRIEKHLKALPEDYMMQMIVSVHNDSDKQIRDRLHFSMSNHAASDAKKGMFAPGSQVGAKCFSEKLRAVYEDVDDVDVESYKENVEWIAVDESYFAMAVHAEGMESCEIKNDKGLMLSKFEMGVDVAAGQSQRFVFDLYLGPKESEYLSPFGHQLEKVIDYGWLEILAKPMAWLLSVFEDWTGNWGLAIILLTIIVRLLLWPVAQRSQESMHQMQKISPLLQEIQAKYKDNPQLMQQKQMELYKEHKINPFGCLPLLLQMPVFFALYRTIFVTGGLYNASFVLWIDDLSSPDRYFVLPLLTTGLFVLMQVLSPSALKTTQQKVMMYSMPVVFGFMMLFLPSGLTLYMLVSTIFSIIQNIYTKRKFAKLDAAASKGGVSESELATSLSAKDRRAAKRREKEESM